MGKAYFESKYDAGDIVIFEKNKSLQAGIIEGYYYQDGNFWYNIRTSQSFVYTYSNGGDIGEFNIIGKLEGQLKEDSLETINELY